MGCVNKNETQMTERISKPGNMLLTGLLISLANLLFILAAAINAVWSNEVGSFYFTIVSMAVSIMLMIVVSYFSFRNYLNILNFFAVTFFIYYAVHGIMILNGAAITMVFPNWRLEQLNYAMVIAYFALIAVANGYVFSSGISFFSIAPGYFHRVISEKNLLSCIIFSICVSITFFVMFVTSLGGLWGYISDMTRLRVSTEFLGTGIYGVPMVIMANIAVFLTFGLKVNRRFWFVLTLIYALLTGFISGFRVNIAILLCGSFLIRHMLKPFKINFKAVISVLLVLLLIGPLPLALRGGYGEVSFSSMGERISYTLTYISSFKASLIFNILLHGDSAIALMSITAKIRENHDYQYGHYSFSALAGLIPRAVWPDRPEIGAEVIKSYFWSGIVGDTGAPAISGVGEAYWEGGLVGVGGVFLLLGVFFRSLEKWRAQLPGNVWAAVTYFIFFWFWSIYSHEVFLGNMGAPFLYLVVMLFFGSFATRSIRI